MIKISFWENFPEVYNLIQFFIDRDLYKKIYDLLYLDEKETMLDIGCGTGGLLSYFKPKEYYGIDLNEKYIEFARKKYKSVNYSFLCENALSYKLPDKHFDLVIVMDLLHHLEDKSVKILLERINNWGKFKKLVIVDGEPKGIFKKVFYFMDAGHFMRPLKDLKEMVSEVYHISKIRSVNNTTDSYRYSIIEIKKTR